MEPDKDALVRLHNDLRTPPANLVEQKPKGGTMLSYVGHAAVTEMLLRHDPLWSWMPLGRDEDGAPIVDRDSNGRPVGMWIMLTIHDHTRIGYGGVEPTDRRSDGDLIKEIIGDGIRNAAMRFGIALNLWSKSDLESEAPDPTAEAVLAQAKGWSKAKRDKIKATLQTAGIIDNPTSFDDFATQVSKHPEVAADVEAWVASFSEQKIVKDLEDIATEEDTVE
jgi:hypothetical protein